MYINARQNEVFLAISRAHRGGTCALSSACAAGLALWRIASLELPHIRPALEAGRSKDRTLHSSADFRIWDLARSVERISLWNLRAQRRVCCGTIHLQDGASTTAVRTPGACFRAPHWKDLKISAHNVTRQPQIQCIRRKK
jgi:hypothetical protein